MKSPAWVFMTGLCMLGMLLLTLSHTLAAPSYQAGCTEQVVNGGFENGQDSTPWVEVSPYELMYNWGQAHSGQWYAWLGGDDRLTEELYQDVTVPASTAWATLTYWWKVTSAEQPTAPPHDLLTVTIRDTSDNVLQQLEIISNASTRDTYVQSTFDVSAYAGQTIRIHFLSQTNNNRITSFFLDDVGLLACDVTPTPTPTLPPPCPEYLQNGGFESGWASWTTTGNPAIVNNPTYAGSRSARLARTRSTTDEVYQSIVVPSDAGAATLSYWWRISSQEGQSIPHDYLYVRIRDDSGATIVEVQQLDNTDVRDEWRQTIFEWPEAGNYAGQTIQIYFLGTSDWWQRTSFYIDEVSFEICTAVSPAYQIDARTEGMAIRARVQMVGGNPEILSWEVLP